MAEPIIFTISVAIGDASVVPETDTTTCVVPYRANAPIAPPIAIASQIMMPF
jgi:hypothetical protein